MQIIDADDTSRSPLYGRSFEVYAAGESHTGVPAFDHIHFLERGGRSDREPPLPQGETFIFKAKES
jgi:hypothetical protein